LAACSGCYYHVTIHGSWWSWNEQVTVQLEVSGGQL
jgi:hypothetical protein